MIKIGTGYYSTEKTFFVDQTASYTEEGFVKNFLVFINEREFQGTGWKNKETLKKSDIPLIRRGGEYKIEKDKITLIFEPSDWREECTIVDEHTLLHHFNDPARKMTFKEWQD